MHPNDFPTRYGHALLDGLADGAPAVVVTMPDLAPAFHDRFDDRHRVLVVTGIEQDGLEALACDVGDVER